MDRYQRVEKPKPEEVISENEIRITAHGLIRNYITYAITLLQEKHEKEIVLKGMGQAISKTVTIAEFIKRRIPGLYQDVSTSSTSITDVWEPAEEGLIRLEINRLVSLITITLSTVELNRSYPGFQEPYLMDPSKPQQQYRPVPVTGFNEAPYGQGQNNGRSRGGGRGRDSYGQVQQYGKGRGRSWGRGGYRNYQESSYHSYGGTGQGRGSGYHGYESGRGGDRGYSYNRGVVNRGRVHGRQAPTQS